MLKSMGPYYLITKKFKTKEKKNPFTTFLIFLNLYQKFIKTILLDQLKSNNRIVYAQKKKFIDRSLKQFFRSN